MKIIVKIFLLLTIVCTYAQVKSPEEQITEAIRALLEALRGSATVIGYNQSGEEIVLRNGTNEMICWADNPNRTDDRGAFFVVCFPKSLEPYMKRMKELGPEGNSTVASEIKSGKIAMPKLAIRYTLRGHSPEGAIPLTVIHVPYATSELTGFSTEIDNFRPWLMLAGTAHAHIMVPGH